ncbi:DUF6612 family protein [Melghirimyces profundicolus]|uniref:DUF6612 family protein n=1 Tax=Melghirimyces profundicolus TaxID=1242148 RepID=UPI000D383E72
MDFTQNPLIYHSTGTLTNSGKKVKVGLYMTDKAVYDLSGKRIRQSTAADRLSIPTMALMEIRERMQDPKTKDSQAITMRKEPDSYIIQVQGGFLYQHDSYRKAFTQQVLRAVEADLRQLKKMGIAPDTTRMQFTGFTQTFHIDRKSFLLKRYDEAIKTRLPGRDPFIFRSEFHYTEKLLL